MKFRSRIVKAVCLVALIGNIFVLPAFAPAVSASFYSGMNKQQLQQELQKVEQEIAQYEKELGTVRAQKNTLANKIAELRTEQAQLQALIKQTDLKIQDLGNKISDTQDAINKNIAKDNQLQSQISLLLQNIDDKDQNSMFQVLSDGGISAMLTEMDNSKQVSDNLSNLLKQVKEVHVQLQQQEDTLTGQQDDAKNFLNLKAAQEAELVGKISDENDLLRQTKGREAAYESQLNNSKAQAAEIRNRLYDLLNVGKQITFGQAVSYAQEASSLTGVRPALLLGILTQETNLGRNVGTCNRAGDPPSKSWRVVMKPSRDQAPFLQITSELGLNPDTTPISCPMHDANGNQVGWGGGMGPAQFIPSTWMGYKDRISALTGNTANPWNIRDAFIAAGLKLKGDGADGSYNGDWAAAMRYFSGSTNPQFRFYGDNVLALAARYEADIKSLQQ